MNFIVTDKDITVSDLLLNYVTVITADYFLNLGNLNVTNWDRIQRTYTADELTENKSKFPSGDVLVKAGTKVFLPETDIKRDIDNQVIDSVFKNTEYLPFISSELNKLMKDPKYVTDIFSYTGQKEASLINNEAVVYIWCRALSKINTTSQEGSWIDVSPFIKSIQTNVTSNGGSFSISLPPLMCEYNGSGWQLSEVSEDGSVANSILLNNDDSGYKRQKFFFSTVLQENDLFYIRFEKLAADNYEYKSILSSFDIPGKIYDMIGLLDAAPISTSFNSVSINVSGRDLMKVLIEDGSYFFVTQFARNIFSQEDTILAKRNYAATKAAGLIAAGYTWKRIDTILKFIFNKFSNIGLIPNSVFNGYGEGAIKNKYQLKSSQFSLKGKDVIDELNSIFLNETREGVWRIMDLVFDPQVAGRVLADNSVSQDNGSIINSIRKIAQYPFVEFFADTYGDKFFFILRKPPFDEKGYRGLVYDQALYDTPNDSINTNSRVGKDDRTTNYINKIRENGFKTSVRVSDISDLVIDIDDSDVLSDQLVYHDEAYSWYRIIPRGLGIISEVQEFEYAPAIPFDEYAEIWGNKTCSIEYNYTPSQYLSDSENDSNYKYIEQQTFYDLQYVIQSNQYLPFARRGVINLKGNRTIKRGMFINYKPTREIFYVDSVSNNKISENSVNVRTTTINVSRGLVEPFIKGVYFNFPSGQELVSYFNIINTNIANDASINNKEFLKNWKVNRNVFNFFIQRRQWTQ